MKRLRFILGLMLALAGSPVWGYVIEANPDQRPSFGFQVGGSLGIDVTQEITTPLPASIERDATAQSLSFQADLLFPLADAWSLQTKMGMESQQQSMDELGLLSGSSIDATTAGGTLTLRRFFINRAFASVPHTKNPDRWPSLALTAGGLGTIYRDGIAILFGLPNLNPTGDVRVWTLGTDARIPFHDSLTFLVNLNSQFVWGNAPETPSTSGNESRVKILTYGGGLRYYFVGHNAIGHDQQINPDRWTSLALTASGQSSVSGHLNVSQEGVVVTRSVDVRGYEVNTEFRLPLTDYLTLNCSASWGRTTQDVSTAPDSLGLKSTTPVLGGTGGFRWYFR